MTQFEIINIIDVNPYSPNSSFLKVLEGNWFPKILTQHLLNSYLMKQCNQVITVPN